MGKTLSETGNHHDTPNTFVFGEKEVLLLKETGIFQKLIDRYGNRVDFYKAESTLGIRFFQGEVSFLVKVYEGERDIVTADELGLSPTEKQRVEQFMAAKYNEIANFGKPKGIIATLDRVLDKIISIIGSKLTRQK